MDACAQLRHDLRDARAEQERELDLARRRFWLGVFGLDFILDWEERSTVDRALAGFLMVVQTGEIVLAVRELFRILQALALRTGRVAAGRVIGRVGSRVLGLAAVGFLVLDVATGYDRWLRTRERIEARFAQRTTALFRVTDCADPARIFREEGIPVP
ncbi:MAG TPA: hypothetical protein VK858_07215 [Longimicrobiales bacterium]|nr:hypothetical protein [Longimicrobiales bacterium]